MWKGNKTWWEQLATGILIIALAVTFSLSGWIGVKARGASRPNLNTTSLYMYAGQNEKLAVNNTQVSPRGMVRAVRTGRCLISAKVKGKTLKCRVQVVTKQRY